MEWIEAKTDWTSNDYINAADFNRIRNNLLYLRTVSFGFFKAFNFSEPLADEQGFQDWAYAETWNTLENALDDLIKNTTRLSDLGNKKTFSVYDSYIDYQELNRIESATVKYKQFFDAQSYIVQKLSFELGNYGGIQL